MDWEAMSKRQISANLNIKTSKCPYLKYSPKEDSLVLENDNFLKIFQTVFLKIEKKGLNITK